MWQLIDAILMRDLLSAAHINLHRNICMIRQCTTWLEQGRLQIKVILFQTYCGTLQWANSISSNKHLKNAYENCFLLTYGTEDNVPTGEA